MIIAISVRASGRVCVCVCVCASGCEGVCVSVCVSELVNHYRHFASSVQESADFLLEEVIEMQQALLDLQAIRRSHLSTECALT